MNKWLPAVAVGAFAITAGVLYLVSGGGEAQDLPIAPPAGEELRLRRDPPPPPPADPKKVQEKLAGQTLLPGDAALLKALEAELAAGTSPTYRTLIDVPFNDNAAPALRDEVKGWVERKMAEFGYTVADRKPTVLWRVALDAGKQGAWKMSVALRSGGDAVLERTLEVPAAYSATRIDQVMAKEFASPSK